MGVVTCGPNEALVVTGFGISKPKFVVGGWVFVWPGLQKVQRLSLNLLTLKVESFDVRTKQGVTISLKATAQVKVHGGMEELLRVASELFLDKDEEEMSRVILETLQGHQMTIMGSMSVEEIYFERKKFSRTVFEEAASDLINMGIQVVSYTMTDVWDSEGYLKDLARKRAEEVKANAEDNKD